MAKVSGRCGTGAQRAHAGRGNCGPPATQPIMAPHRAETGLLRETTATDLPPMPLIERVLHLTAGLSLAAALLLAAARPKLVIFGWGHPLLPGALHLMTLGSLVSLAYAQQHSQWRRLYGERAPWTPLLWFIWMLHVDGGVLLAWGFLAQDTRLALIGGHYLLPTGIVLALVHGWLAARRRPRGSARRLAAHLPGLGLVVAGSLGALLVLEARQPRWGLYSPETILAHLLAAGFLFVLPTLLLPAALPPAARSHSPGGAPATPAARAASPGSAVALLRWYATTGVGAGGVLLVLLALGEAPPPRLLPVGLALLGAQLVWLGLPGPGPLRGVILVPLAGRLATGVLLFYAALRFGRGAGPADALWLAKVGVLLFMAGVALPEMLAERERDAATPPGGTLARQSIWLAGTTALVAGQLWTEPALVRAGALIWLGGLAWHAWVAWVAGRVALPAQEAGR